MSSLAVGEDDMIELARQARKRAFCPYSEYPVGAALDTEKGVYTASNIEISGRSTSVHAEMLAAFKAVDDGATSFHRLAVSPKNQSGEAICGLCQHTLAQFTDELEIYEDRGDKPPTEYRLSELIGPAYSPSTRHNTIPDDAE
jgi:cytidine deaminase